MTSWSLRTPLGVPARCCQRRALVARFISSVCEFLSLNSWNPPVRTMRTGSRNFRAAIANYELCEGKRGPRPQRCHPGMAERLSVCCKFIQFVAVAFCCLQAVAMAASDDAKELERVLAKIRSEP